MPYDVLPACCCTALTAWLQKRGWGRRRPEWSGHFRATYNAPRLRCQGTKNLRKSYESAVCGASSGDGSVHHGRPFGHRPRLGAGREAGDGFIKTFRLLDRCLPRGNRHEGAGLSLAWQLYRLLLHHGWRQFAASLRQLRRQRCAGSPGLVLENVLRRLELQDAGRRPEYGERRRAQDVLSQTP